MKKAEGRHGGENVDVILGRQSSSASIFLSINGSGRGSGNSCEKRRNQG